MIAEQNKCVEIGFKGGVGVDRSILLKEGVPNRGASMKKTTRGESNLDTRLGEKIEGRHPLNNLLITVQLQPLPIHVSIINVFNISNLFYHR